MKNRWKIFLVGFLCLLLSAGCDNNKGEIQATDLTDKVEKVVRKSVTQKELLEHLEFLTSERLAGRPTGSWNTGISLETIIVTDYLKSKCSNWKLQPAGEKQSPNQHFRAKSFLRFSDSLNIAFYIPGSELSKEYIVLVAHYDHIGYGSASRLPKEYQGKQIHPGADDNASGVSALLELAQVFSDLYDRGIRPKRSIIFLFVGAEELGLHGSSCYAINFPLEGEIVTAISLDMVGRCKAPDSFDLIACPLTHEAPERIPEILAYVQKWKDIFGFSKVNFPVGYFSRSDHYSFWKNSPIDNRIPSLLLMAGIDEGKRVYYHTIWDTLRDGEGNLNINLDYLERFSEFVTILVWEIANGLKPDYVEKLN